MPRAIIHHAAGESVMPKGAKPLAKNNKEKLTTKEKQEKKKEKLAKKAAK